jgi:glycosyltransferase involved in cell wall biosynthesis
MIILNKNKKKNSKFRPLISVITVTYNRAKYLEKTILSVLRQKYKNFEYIVVDGGSTDCTKNIILKYKNFIDKIIFDNDKGIYDAFNKGIALAEGEFIGIINSDDVYTPNALQYVINYYRKDNSFDFIFGAVKKHYATLFGFSPWKIFYTWGFYSSHSTGFFIKKEKAKELYGYNLKYKFSSDYDYFYRMIVKKKMKGIGTKKEELFGIFRRGGFSSKTDFIKHTIEELQIRKDNNQNLIFLFFILIIKIIFNYKKIFKSLKKRFLLPI